MPSAVSSLLSARPKRPGSKAASRVAIVARVNVQTTGKSALLSPRCPGLFRTGPRFPALKSYSSFMKHVQRQQSLLNLPRRNLVANALQHLAENAIGQPETLEVKF